MELAFICAALSSGLCCCCCVLKMKNRMFKKVRRISVTPYWEFTAQRLKAICTQRGIRSGLKSEMIQDLVDLEANAEPEELACTQQSVLKSAWLFDQLPDGCLDDLFDWFVTKKMFLLLNKLLTLLTLLLLLLLLLLLRLLLLLVTITTSYYY